ncbi:MAG: hypothetical protein QGG64_23240 [Candidatus Latescibacteria bacterium]|nr:hypothetical protein [Candidatus Latescibacterota bacterium]
MIRLLEHRDQLYQAGIIVGLFVVFCVGLIYHFTIRTLDGSERERAHIMLQRIVALEHTYRSEYGTYLPIDRENNGEELHLNDVLGQFHYKVTVSEDGFVAHAEADFDGDGQAEIWRVDATQSDPVLIQRD